MNFQDESGQASFWTLFGILLIITAYLVNPELFIDFLLDFLFDTVRETMS